MKFEKILLAASIAAVSTTAFASTGGFYIGANTGASFEKCSVEGQNPKKTKVIAEGVLGYDFHFDTIVLGMDFEFGTTFGKFNDYYGDMGSGYEFRYSRKTQWQLGFMPRIGYLITPDCEIYLTAGARVVKHKTIRTAIDSGSKAIDGIDSFKKTKVHPVAGLGMRYDFNPNLFAKFEYNYLFKTKCIPYTKYQAHGFKLGFGYKF